MMSSDHGYHTGMKSVEDTLEQAVTAAPEVVAPMRARLADFAARAGAGPDLVDAVRLVVSEVITNAVVHAYAGAPGPVTVRACVRGGQLSVLIADEGSGVQARAARPGLGLGLGLISRLSQAVVIQARPGGGTEVRVRFDLAPGARDAAPVPAVGGLPDGAPARHQLATSLAA